MIRQKNGRTFGLILFMLLVLSVTVGEASGNTSTLVGAFDVGPTGAPESVPYYATAGISWLMKVWSPLLSYNEDCSGLSPKLAVEWEADSCDTVWTFHLRKGVQWHDGEPFTAEDVKFTFELAFHPAAMIQASHLSALTDLVGYSEFVAGKAEEIKGIKIIDEATIRFEMDNPSPRFPYHMLTLLILPKHVFADVSPSQLKTADWWGEKAIGTGPFKFVNHVPGQYIELAANPYYWNGKPKIDKLINRYFADPSSSVIALQRGEIQFAPVELDDATYLAKAGFRVISGPSGTTNYIIFNHRNPIFQDKRVRQAFHYAIDRQSIVEQIFKGGATVVPCISPHEALWPNESKRNEYEYNPTKARELLAEAGWDPEYEFEVWTYYTSQDQKDALQAIQAYLSDVGIKVVPRLMDVPAYNAQFYTGIGWDMSYRGATGNLARYSFGNYLSDGYPGAEGNSLSGYKNAEFDQLLRQAQSESRADRYLELLKEIGRWQNEEAIDVYLWTSTRYAAVSKKVEQLYWYPVPGSMSVYEDHAETWSVY